MCYSNEVQVLLLSCLKITELIQYSGDKECNSHLCFWTNKPQLARTQLVQLESLSELKTHATYFHMFKVISNHIFNSLVIYNRSERAFVCLKHTITACITPFTLQTLSQQLLRHKNALCINLNTKGDKTILFPQAMVGNIADLVLWSLQDGYSSV